MSEPPAALRDALRGEPAVVRAVWDADTAPLRASLGGGSERGVPPTARGVLVYERGADA